MKRENGWFWRAESMNIARDTDHLNGAMRVSMCVIAAALMVLSGCAPPPSACVPGEVRICPCTGGQTGTQTCDAQGSAFGECSGCAATPDGGWPFCTPNTTRACICPGNVTGSQTCNASGTDYSVCACSTPTTCNASNPSGTCPNGETCVGGSCCSTDAACGAVCCNANAVCVVDGAGNRACAQRCTTTSQCPGTAGTQCCRTLYDENTNEMLSYGACGTFNGSNTCRCTTGSECASGSCAPRLNANNNPVGPYICKQAGGCQPYTTCPGLGSCPSGYCDLCDSRGNCFCAQVCSNDSMCGDARCTTYPTSVGSCSAGQRACAPQP